MGLMSGMSENKKTIKTLENILGDAFQQVVVDDAYNTEAPDKGCIISDPNRITLTLSEPTQAFLKAGKDGLLKEGSRTFTGNRKAAVLEEAIVHFGLQSS